MMVWFQVWVKFHCDPIWAQLSHDIAFSKGGQNWLQTNHLGDFFYQENEKNPVTLSMWEYLCGMIRNRKMFKTSLILFLLHRTCRYFMFFLTFGLFKHFYICCSGKLIKITTKSFNYMHFISWETSRTRWE